MSYAGDAPLNFLLPRHVAKCVGTSVGQDRLHAFGAGPVERVGHQTNDAFYIGAVRAAALPVALAGSDVVGVDKPDQMWVSASIASSIADLAERLALR